MGEKTIKIFFRGGDSGNLNLGDQAMALNMVEKLKQRIDNFKLIIVTNSLDNSLKINNAEYIISIFAKEGKISSILNSVGLVFFNRLLQLLKCFYILLNGFLYKQFKFTFLIQKEVKNFIVNLSESDIIWFGGGGGFFNDIATISGVYMSTLICLLSNIFKKKIIMTGIGIGPLENKINIKLLAYGLRKVEFIGLRDYENSKKILMNKLNFNESKIFTIGDDATSLKCVDENTINSIVQKEKIFIKSPLFGVNFRKSNCRRIYSHQEKNFLSLVFKQILDLHGGSMLFIPTKYASNSDDRNAELDILQQMRGYKNAKIIMGQYNPHEIKSIIGKTDFFLGFSYHSLVFALTQGIPSIGFYSGDYYRTKILGLFAFFGLTDFTVDIERCHIDEIIKKINKLIDERIQIKKILNYGTNEMTKRLEGLIDKVAATIRG